MTLDIPARDRAARHNAWIAASIDLQTPHLHDFSDFGWSGVRHNLLLRWIMVIVAVMTIAHFVQHAGAQDADAASGLAVAVASPR